jgi:protein subunit release factor A
MPALITTLEECLRSGSKVAEDAFRRQQIDSGMLRDQRKTYRFQVDTVVDHVTKKSGSVPQLW